MMVSVQVTILQKELMVWLKLMHQSTTSELVHQAELNWLLLIKVKSELQHQGITHLPRSLVTMWRRLHLVKNALKELQVELVQENTHLKDLKQLSNQSHKLWFSQSKQVVHKALPFQDRLEEFLQVITHLPRSLVTMWRRLHLGKNVLISQMMVSVQAIIIQKELKAKLKLMHLSTTLELVHQAEHN